MLGPLLGSFLPTTSLYSAVWSQNKHQYQHLAMFIPSACADDNQTLTEPFITFPADTHTSLKAAREMYAYVLHGAQYYSKLGTAPPKVREFCKASMLRKATSVPLCSLPPFSGYWQLPSQEQEMRKDIGFLVVSLWPKSILTAAHMRDAGNTLHQWGTRGRLSQESRLSRSRFLCYPSFWSP